jgi:hypothetical protein
VRLPALALLASFAALGGCATLPRPDGLHGPSERDGRLLEAGPSTVRVELDRVRGADPRPAALSVFLQRLRHTTGKARVELVVDDVVEPDQWEAGPRPIRELAARLRDEGRTGSAGIHLLYAPRWGFYRGYAWPARTMERLQDGYDAPLVVVLSSQLRPIAWITGVRQEASVLVHEVGHTFGLSTDPGHSHAAHCTNGWCSMYNGIDARTALFYLWPTLLFGYLPLDYCPDCRADLAPSPEPR